MVAARWGGLDQGGAELRGERVGCEPASSRGKDRLRCGDHVCPPAPQLQGKDRGCNYARRAPSRNTRILDLEKPLRHTEQTYGFCDPPRTRAASRPCGPACECVQYLALLRHRLPAPGRACIASFNCASSRPLRSSHPARPSTLAKNPHSVCEVCRVGPSVHEHPPPRVRGLGVDSDNPTPMV